MSRLISAFRAAEAVCRAFNIPIGDMVDVLAEVPTIEAVPVVRCRDCKHSYDCPGGLICSYGVCVDCIVPPDFYCSYGERKEESQ